MLLLLVIVLSLAIEDVNRYAIIGSLFLQLIKSTQSILVEWKKENFGKAKMKDEY